MNIELRLLATMLKTGNFGPIIRNEVNEEHFRTGQGEAIYGFIVNYKHTTDGASPWPSLAIIRERFRVGGDELPEPDPADSVENLAYEVRVKKYRTDIQAFALEAENIAEAAVDPISAIAPLIQKLRKSTEAHLKVQHASLATSLPLIVEQYRNKEILPEGIPLPWPTLNHATRGMQRREFMVLCGRPKSRKTFTGLRILCHAVKHHHCRALVFSPEMPVRQMLLRCIAHLADLPYAEFKDGSLAEADEARLYDIAKRYGRVKDDDDASYQLQLAQHIPGLGDAFPSLDIVQSTGRDTAWLAQQIEIYRPDIVMVDSFYKQRSPGGRKHDSDWKAVTAVSRELKDLAMETGVCLIGTHQLNRDAQRSLGDMSNVALADAISQDTDALYRVVTGKIEGQDVSALYSYALRDTACEGVMINNAPCYDYSEIGPIVNRQQVEDLMKQEDRALAKEQSEKLAQHVGAPASKPTSKSIHVDFGRRGNDREGKFKRSNKRAMEQSVFTRQLDADYKRAVVDE